jgi:hypothetical protein
VAFDRELFEALDRVSKRFDLFVVNLHGRCQCDNEVHRDRLSFLRNPRTAWDIFCEEAEATVTQLGRS